MAEVSFFDRDGTLAEIHALPVVGPVSTHHPGELKEVRAAFVVSGFADPAVYDRPYR